MLKENVYISFVPTYNNYIESKKLETKENMKWEHEYDERILYCDLQAENYKMLNTNKIDCRLYRISKI